MTSSRIAIEPKRRAAIRFLNRVHRKLNLAYARKPDLTQAHIARSLGVNRSVVNRQLRGGQDMTLSTAAELAWAMGMTATFDLLDQPAPGQNVPTSGVITAPAYSLNVITSVVAPVQTYFDTKHQAQQFAVGQGAAIQFRSIDLHLDVAVLDQ